MDSLSPGKVFPPSEEAHLLSVFLLVYCTLLQALGWLHVFLLTILWAQSFKDFKDDLKGVNVWILLAVYAWSIARKFIGDISELILCSRLSCNEVFFSLRNKHRWTWLTSTTALGCAFMFFMELLCAAGYASMYKSSDGTIANVLGYTGFVFLCYLGTLTKLLTIMGCTFLRTTTYSVRTKKALEYGEFGEDQNCCIHGYVLAKHRLGHGFFSYRANDCKLPQIWTPDHGQTVGQLVLVLTEAGMYFTALSPIDDYGNWRRISIIFRSMYLLLLLVEGFKESRHDSCWTTSLNMLRAVALFSTFVIYYDRNITIGVILLVILVVTHYLLIKRHWVLPMICLVNLYQDLGNSVIDAVLLQSESVPGGVRGWVGNPAKEFFVIPYLIAVLPLLELLALALTIYLASLFLTSSPRIPQILTEPDVGHDLPWTKLWEAGLKPLSQFSRQLPIYRCAALAVVADNKWPTHKALEIVVPALSRATKLGDTELMCSLVTIIATYYSEAHEHGICPQIPTLLDALMHSVQSQSNMQLFCETARALLAILRKADSGGGEDLPGSEAAKIVSLLKVLLKARGSLKCSRRVVEGLKVGMSLPKFREGLWKRWEFVVEDMFQVLKNATSLTAVAGGELARGAMEVLSELHLQGDAAAKEKVKALVEKNRGVIEMICIDVEWREYRNVELEWILWPEVVQLGSLEVGLGTVSMPDVGGDGSESSRQS